VRLVIWIPGVPQPQPRAKGRRFRRASDGVEAVRIYTPRGKSTAWRAAVRAALAPHVQPEPLAGPLALSVAFFFPRPQRLLTKRAPAHPIPYDHAPDRDNLDKLPMDVATEVGLWKDDGQVTMGAPSKWYAAKDGSPGALLVLEQMDAERAWYTANDPAVREVRARSGGAHAVSSRPAAVAP
jgi:Holliday junction resolvase RusA-like endonuclease